MESKLWLTVNPAFKDDLDLKAKLMEQETFYNCNRPPASLKGKTPYEILLEKRQSHPTSTEVIPSAPRRVETCRHFPVAPISPLRAINASEEVRCGLPHSGGNGVRDHESS
jgi:hypothetical protein